MLLFALLAAAAPVPDDDGFSYTITVHGEPAIRQARWDAVIALKRLGWDPRQKDGGRTVFKPPRPWLGRAELDAEGNLSFRYPLVRFRSASLSPTQPMDPTESNPHLQRSPSGHMRDGGFTLPAGQAGLWIKPSHKILDGWYDRTRIAVEPQLRNLAIARRDTAIAARLDEVIAQLDALWADGTPLVGGQPVPEPERTRAVLFFWATRADSFEGQQVTRTVETWLRNNVEPTEEQRTAAEKLRQDGRRLPRPDRPSSAPTP